mgnify:CR=1 FL=1
MRRLNFCAITADCMAHTNYFSYENCNKNATQVGTGSLSICTPSELVPTWIIAFCARLGYLSIMSSVCWRLCSSSSGSALWYFKSHMPARRLIGPEVASSYNILLSTHVEWAWLCCANTTPAANLLYRTKKLKGTVCSVLVPRPDVVISLNHLFPSRLYLVLVPTRWLFLPSHIVRVESAHPPFSWAKESSL